MDHIPTPPVGLVKVVLRADCRYGVVDPIQHPQIYSQNWEYLCMVSRPHPQRPHNHALTFTPTREDFLLFSGSTIKCLGLLRVGVLSPLSEVVDEVHEAISRSRTLDPHLGWLDIMILQARDRLRHFPCTFRDVLMQVRETQRYCIMARAFLDFQRLQIPAAGAPPQPVNHAAMGAFTTDPGLVQRLFAAGVPVWYLRTDVSIMSDDRVCSVVELSKPTDICTTVGEEGGTVLYSGLAGTKHFEAMARGGHTYLDISHAPLLAVDEDGGYAAPLSQKAHKHHPSKASASSPAGPVRTSCNVPRPSRGGPSAVPCKKSLVYGLVNG